MRQTHFFFSVTKTLTVTKNKALLTNKPQWTDRTAWSYFMWIWNGAI